jgi:hypothetical protein
MRSRKIDLLLLARRRAVAGAIIVCAKMRAALDHAVCRLPRRGTEADEFRARWVDRGLT